MRPGHAIEGMEMMHRAMAGADRQPVCRPDRALEPVMSAADRIRHRKPLRQPRRYCRRVAASGAMGVLRMLAFCCENMTFGADQQIAAGVTCRPFVEATEKETSHA